MITNDMISLGGTPPSLSCWCRSSTFFLELFRLVVLLNVLDDIHHEAICQPELPSPHGEIIPKLLPNILLAGFPLWPSRVGLLRHPLREVSIPLSWEVLSRNVHDLPAKKISNRGWSRKAMTWCFPPSAYTRSSSLAP